MESPPWLLRVRGNTSGFRRVQGDPVEERSGSGGTDLLPEQVGAGGDRTEDAGESGVPRVGASQGPVPRLATYPTRGRGPPTGQDLDGAPEFERRRWAWLGWGAFRPEPPSVRKRLAGRVSVPVRFVAALCAAGGVGRHGAWRVGVAGRLPGPGWSGWGLGSRGSGRVAVVGTGVPRVRRRGLRSGVAGGRVVCGVCV